MSSPSCDEQKEREERYLAMTEQESDRYHQDAAYRLTFGPTIEAWGVSGNDESLVGLEIVLDFKHHGQCRGIVRGVKESRHSDDSVFHVVWTCNDNDKEEYSSQLSAAGVVGWYLHDKEEKPSWLDDEDDEEYDRGKNCPLFSTPAGSKLVGFHIPYSASEYAFPWVTDERQDDRWFVTLARLNDPACARMYGTGIKAYPLPLLLAMIAICQEYDPSTKVPLIVTNDRSEVFDLADTFTRRLAGSRGVGPLEEVIQTVHATVPTTTTTDEEAWLRAYKNVYALLLALSDEYENRNDGFIYSDRQSVYEACARLVTVLGAVLLNPPSDAMKQRIGNDRVLKHLKAGSFKQFVEDDEFERDYPDAALVWTQLRSLDD